MRFLSLSFLVLGSALLGGCGTIVNGQTQNVTLEALGAEEVQCAMDNGVRYSISKGDTVRVMRTNRPLTLDCYAAGNRHKKFIVPEGVNPVAATGNIATGVVPGMAYDHLSGGLYEYPETILVDFLDMRSQGYELPDYHNKEMPNPYNQPIEYYGASQPRFDSDSAYLGREVKKSQPSLNSGNPFGWSSPKPILSTEPPGTPATSAPMQIAPDYSKGGVPPWRQGGSGPGYVPMGSNAEELTRSANPQIFVP